jgi:hypothetical protein
MHALQSALAAAGAILQSGAERERALNNYRHSIERSFEKYLKAYADLYGQEGRWPAAEFWRRRRIRAAALGL